MGLTSEYRARLDAGYDGDGSQFQSLYDTLESHGFAMLDFDDAKVKTRELRLTYDAQLEYLIDALQAPRGFWGHEIGHRLTINNALIPNERLPTVEQ